jgi:hypothetical protein
MQKQPAYSPAAGLTVLFFIMFRFSKKKRQLWKKNTGNDHDLLKIKIPGG